MDKERIVISDMKFKANVKTAESTDSDHEKAAFEATGYTP